MASNSFKVKNSLVLTPKDLSTLTSPEAGDLACDINDSNKIKRYDANSAAWVEVGSGGVGGVDIFFVQDFESASLSSFTQTGLVLSQTDPLKGKVSAVLTHQAAVNQSFKQIIPVDRKFRGQTMVLRLDAKSSASAGNLVIKITNETASTDLVASEQLEISNDVNGAKSSVSFTIPESCASLSYTITALPQSGSPVSRIDDIICELASTALLETAVEVPVVTGWQGYTPTFQGFGTPTNVEFEWRQVGENVEIRGKFVSGTSTAVEARIGLPAGLTSASTALIPSLQIIGKANINNSSTAFFSSLTILAEPSVNYVTMGIEASTTNGLTKQIGSNLAVNGSIISFFASVPCASLSATTTKTIPLTQSGLVQEADSYLRISGASVGSAKRNWTFSTIKNNSGSAIQYTKDSVNGDKFTVLESGVYSISVCVGGFLNTTGAQLSYIVKNLDIVDPGGAANLQDFLLNASNYNGTSSPSPQNPDNTISWTGYLTAGEFIKIGNSLPASSYSNYNTDRNSISISKQSSLKQVSVNPNSKITIPTSELRMEGASSRGSTATAIVRFDNVAKLRGDAFTVESDAVLGTRITMKKAGKLDISASIYAGAARYLTLTRNQTDLTTAVVGATQSLNAEYTSGNDDALSASWSGDVNVGDIIRVASSAVPLTNNTLNHFDLYFQEQEIQVSVSNTLPQFSESDLVVRAADNAGQSITPDVTNVPFQTSFDSTGGAWNGTQFTVPESGIYNITTSVAFTTNNSRSVMIYKNGVVFRRIGELSTTATQTHYGNIEDQFSAGDVLSFRINGSGGTLLSTTVYHYLNITKVGKPNVTGVDVTPFVNVPQPQRQLFQVDQSVTTATGSTVTGVTYTTVNGSGILSYSSSTGLFTALKNCVVSASCSLQSSGAGNVEPMVLKNGSAVGISTSVSAGNARATATATIELKSGDQLSFYNNGGIASNRIFASVSAEAISDSILTAPETFSTDTASLQYASSSQYTLSTLANAPVGTYITFTYAANTNTRTQTTTRPTQTDADMNANGMLIYPRAFNATSTSGNPSVIAIQIGKGLKGLNLGLYKSAGKVTPGEIDFTTRGNDHCGLFLKSYDEKTGIIMIDAGWAFNGSNTSWFFNFSDISNQTSGYLVINASKNPALTGLGLNTVAASVRSTSGQTFNDGSTTTPTWDSAKVYDTHNAFNASTSTFTAPETGYYVSTISLSFNIPASTRFQIGFNYVVNGTSTVFAPALAATQNATNSTTGYSSSHVVYLKKGDSLQVTAFQESGAARTLVTQVGRNTLTIAKTSIGTGN